MILQNTQNMDLNENGTLFSCNNELAKKNTYGDTTLRLDCFGYGGSRSIGFVSTRTNPKDRVVPSNDPDDGCRLVLGLGPTPSTYSDDYYRTAVIKNKGSAAKLHQGLSSEGDSILKLGLSGRTEQMSRVLEYSISTQRNKLVIPVVDEGSTSAKKSGGYMPSLLLAPRMDSSTTSIRRQEVFKPSDKSHFRPSQLVSEPCALTDYSSGTVSERASTGASSDQRTSNAKKCKFVGCSKGARGATGLCIGHGGGQRCQKQGCTKGSESRTAFCKAHGGGRRCQYLGCTKSAEGRTDHCIAHGGGRRCGHPTGCNKAGRGKSGLCIKHGGGKRCTVEGCTRSAEGHVGLCISHGGGRRCQFRDCTKGAQGGTMFCKGHGGGKRCVFSGCTKGAEGSTPLCKGHGGGKRCLFDGGGICPKSVHGGTNFCVAHGGGKRCSIPGCTKSARGRTDCCVRHGGGKRCRIENCGKSAQGSTDFCKAHGGGKRCNWEERKCEKFARGKSGLCAAHSNMVQDRETNKVGMIGPRLFHGLVPSASTVMASFDTNCSSSGVSVVSDSIESLERPAKRQHLIPPQVLVPSSMKASSSYSTPWISGNGGEVGGIGGSSVRKSGDYAVSEGRVHGGGIFSLFGGNLKNPINGN